MAKNGDLATSICDMFDPRKSCTTCNYRCVASEKDRLIGSGDGCTKWVLRELSSWGGARRFRKSKKTKKDGRKGVK